jgi:general secretion pathway protein G
MARLSTEQSIVTGKLRSASGFTIIELMVVMALIVTLSTIAVVQYRHSVVYSKEAILKEDLFRMKEAIDQYYADKNQYPATLEDLVTSGYLRTIPNDPITNSASTWETVPAEPDPNNPISVGGVYSVKSGSDATAMDGSKYNDW